MKIVCIPIRVLCFLLLGTARIHGLEEPVSLKAQLGHNDNISSIAQSHDGKYFVSSSYDRTLKLWNIETGKELRTYEPSVNRITNAVISTDDRYVAAGDDQNRCVVWDLRTGVVQFVLEGHTAPVYAIRFTSDNRYLITAAQSGMFSSAYETAIRLWDLKTGKELRRYSGHADKIISLDVSPVNTQFISRGMDKKIIVWDTELPGPVKILNTRTNDSIPAIFSKDGESVISGDAIDSWLTRELEYSIRIWDIKSGVETKSIRLPSMGIRCLAASGNGKYIACGSNHQFSLWEIRSGKMVDSVDHEYGTTHSIDFAKAEDTLIIGFQKPLVCLYDFTTRRYVRQYSGKTAAVTSLDLSPDGKFAVSSVADLHNGSILLWDLQAVERKAVLGKPLGSYDSITFSRDGSRIIANGGDAISVFDTTSGKEVLSVKGTFANNAELSPDNRYIVASRSSVIYLIDAKKGTLIRTFSGHGDIVSRKVFSSDGKWIVSCSFDRTIKIWETETGKLARTLTVQTPIISTIDLSPDDAYIISSSQGILSLWDFKTGKAINMIEAHSTLFNALEFSKDGKFAISGSMDKTIKVWTIPGLVKVREFEGHSNTVSALSASSDGRFLLSGSEDTTMKIWDFSSGACVANFVSSLNGTKWMAFTGDNYWDGSDNSSELVAVVKGMDSWNVDQFAVRNNRPDIIARRIGAPPEVIAEFKAAWLKRLRRLEVSESGLSADYRVPQTLIVDARQDAKVQKGKFVDLSLSFSSDGKPLTRYQVYVNDVPLFGAVGKPLMGDKVEVGERIELVKGENKVEVSCMDSGGAESFRANRIMSWNGDASPNLYLLAFGVSDYADPTIRDLKYAAKDALSLEALFKSLSGKGFGRVFTQVYTDEMVTRISIAQAKGFLQGSRPDDTLVLFISGHGVQVAGKYSPSAASAGSAYYYVTSDAKLSDIPGTAADFDAIEDLLQGIPPRQKLFLMDTCESGEADEPGAAVASAGTRGIYARTLDPATLRGLSVVSTGYARHATRHDRWIYNDLVRRSGAIVFSSSGGNEASLEVDDWQQGVFTYSILEAFRGQAADKDRNGIVSVDELKAYVMETVPVLVKKIAPDAEQHPTVDRDNIFVKFGFPVQRK